jgi:hypothetical protein
MRNGVTRSESVWCQESAHTLVHLKKGQIMEQNRPNLLFTRILIRAILVLAVLAAFAMAAGAPICHIC